MQALADPRITSESVAQRIIEEQPAVYLAVPMVCMVTRFSSTDAAMLTAYHLLASRSDERIDSIMENTIVVIDPMQNPDGRDRFIHNYVTAEGLVPGFGSAIGGSTMNPGRAAERIIICSI